MDATDIKAVLKKYTALVDEALSKFIPPAEGQFKELAEAMRYSVFAGGKRLRPALVLECASLLGADVEDAMPAACAVEMIHTYSLIHDDLPAMDDDDLRRGKPSCHKAFGEATAILAGDALLTLAFETVARTAGNKDAAYGRDAVLALAHAAGPLCLVGGQVLDMDGEKAASSIEEVEAIHDHKTADLLAVSCVLGGIAGGASKENIAKLDRYGRALGHAFQIADDILDVTSTPEELGKSIGKDAETNKATYVTLLGLDGAKEAADTFVVASEDALKDFGTSSTEFLLALARYVVERKN